MLHVPKYKYDRFLFYLDYFVVVKRFKYINLVMQLLYLKKKLNWLLMIWRYLAFILFITDKLSTIYKFIADFYKQFLS